MVGLSCSHQSLNVSDIQLEKSKCKQIQYDRVLYTQLNLSIIKTNLMSDSNQKNAKVWASAIEMRKSKVDDTLVYFYPICPLIKQI